MRAIKLPTLAISGFPTSFVVAVAISLLATILMRSDQIVFAQGTVGETKELILDPTEVGSPVGNKVTKDIGPAGGTLSSADGRLTLTVRQNALQETIRFSIQPVTNRVPTGIGLAYRLEPDGKTFTTPLELSVRYDERDLEGTAAESLAIAFQGKDRKWHVLNPTRLDDTNRSITFSTTHFTDFSFLARMRLEPSTARLRVGETMQIKLIGCGEPHPIIGEFSRSCNMGGGNMGGRAMIMEWYADIGTITSQMNPAMYTAPPRKPRPNVATVSVPYALTDYRGDKFILPGDVVFARRGMFTAKITIVDWGYKVIGGTGGLTFSGVVCSLEEPFTIKGASMPSILNYTFKFTPSSSAAGSFTYTVSGAGFTAKSSGSYTVDGIDTNRPKIVIPPSQATGTWRTLSTSPTFRLPSIELEPLDTPECE